MKNILFSFLLTISSIAFSQNFTKATNNAFLISRMVEKYHVQPKTVDKNFSEEWFTEILHRLDDDKIFFTEEDIQQLNVYKYQLNDQLKLKKTDFIQLLYTIFQTRLHQVDTMIDNICSTPFNFSSKECFTVKEDTSYAANTKALRSKLSKHLKTYVLYSLVEMNEDTVFTNIKLQKKYNDSLEIGFRKKAKSSYKRFIKLQLEIPGGVAESIGNTYCKTLAECYDPHTTFFPLTEKENFEGRLGNKKMIFGFKLDEDDDGNIMIDHLKPGSSAFKSGQINNGDKIIALQWEGKESVDVSDATMEEISVLLAASNDSKLTITIKKADGSVRQVVLNKEKEEANTAEDDGKVKSFLLKGNKTIGFISLPDFYTDWDNKPNSDEGCANDISKEIMKLKKENISGLIIDLRYNGGGSMAEATNLAGIFIDAGPVGQLMRKEGKALTVKDMNRGTVYDGPLLILVNGYSASASEMVAGTLQDYNRAIIAGSTTYGKATAQIVLPLDTTINIYEYNNHDLNKQDSYIKLTVEKLYRVSGNTAQFNGVIPDVVFPDIKNDATKREADNPHSLKAGMIEANKYYKPLPDLDIKTAKSAGQNFTDTSSFFKSIKKINTEQQTFHQKDITLNLMDAIAESKKKNMNEEEDVSEFESAATAPYSVENHSYELVRLHADKELEELNLIWKKHLSKDPYIQAAYHVISSIIK